MNRCKDLFKRIKYFGVRCTLTQKCQEIYGRCKNRGQEEESPVEETLYNIIIVKCFSVEGLTEVGAAKEEVHVYLGE